MTVVTRKVKCSRCGRVRGLLATTDGHRHWVTPTHRTTNTVVLRRLGVDIPTTSLDPVDIDAERPQVVPCPADCGRHSDDVHRLQGALAGAPSGGVDLAGCKCAPNAHMPAQDFKDWLRNGPRVLSIGPDAYR